MDDLSTRFRATMILSAVGDVIGYRNGEWEFNYKGEDIHKQLKDLGGLKKLNLKRWKVSDDTVMHLATARALVKHAQNYTNDDGSIDADDALHSTVADEYVACFDDMEDRAPGKATKVAVARFEKGSEWNTTPYSKSGGGCGASMRSMCFGLVFYGLNNRKKLTASSIESGRITHNHPTGFLGAWATAFLTAYAFEGIPPLQWGSKLLSEFHYAYEYLESDGRNWETYQKDLKFFEEQWKKYLGLRKITAKSPRLATFPKAYGIKERDSWYDSISFSGWGGSSGHDSVIISYDALLGCKGDWQEFLLRGALHGGDSDSTGAIGGAWFGALYGFKSVPKNHLKDVEYLEKLEGLADSLFQISENIQHDPTNEVVNAPVKRKLNKKEEKEEGKKEDGEGKSEETQEKKTKKSNEKTEAK
eukprot:TRINITY_DN8595_c0_g1_i1.p1 TRINITY_DN8595_c0_g1~~TRINITY_DN8595_c0_g1_i1.p1  ORF type:complete len:417 (-),score=130.58 TRINITY_DN8595_c0_g1_i1:36-1286(-)